MSSGRIDAIVSNSYTKSAVRLRIKSLSVYRPSIHDFSSASIGFSICVLYMMMMIILIIIIIILYEYVLSCIFGITCICVILYDVHEKQRMDGR